MEWICGFKQHSNLRARTHRPIEETNRVLFFVFCLAAYSQPLMVCMCGVCSNKFSILVDRSITFYIHVYETIMIIMIFYVLCVVVWCMLFLLLYEHRSNLARWWISFSLRRAVLCYLGQFLPFICQDFVRFFLLRCTSET